MMNKEINEKIYKSRLTELKEKLTES